MYTFIRAFTVVFWVYVLRMRDMYYATELTKIAYEYVEARGLRGFLLRPRLAAHRLWPRAYQYLPADVLIFGEMFHCPTPGGT